MKMESSPETKPTEAEEEPPKE
jgi:hypothetical protein